MQTRIEQEILALNNTNVSAILLPTLKKEDYNLLFRQTSAAEAALDITKFLYQHIDELKLDVNAKGLTSKKSALDIAIEHNNPDTVLYLLKLEEIEVDDSTIDKIEAKFGTNFRIDYIERKYDTLGKKFEQKFTPIRSLLAENIKKTRLVVDAVENLSKTTLQLSSKATTEESRAEILQMCLQQMDIIYKPYSQDLGFLFSTCESIQKIFDQLLSYSYAYEKTLRSNSTLKNDCIKQRIGSQTVSITLHTVQEEAVIHLNVIVAMFRNTLVGCATLKYEATLMNKSLPPEEVETMPVLEDIQELDKQDPIKPKDLPEPDKKVIIEVTLQEKPKKKPTKKAHRESNQKDLPKAPPQKVLLQPVPTTDKYERLTDFQQQLTDLKQKGNIKSSVFLDILKGIGQEIDLQIKKTKSGLLVSQGTNRFSFHTPHKNSSGKGIDPAAVASAVEIVAQNIANETSLSK